MVELILISQEMDAPVDLVVDLEEDLGLNKLKPEHDQRKPVSLGRGYGIASVRRGRVYIFPYGRQAR